MKEVNRGIKTGEIARYLNGELKGDPFKEIRGVSSIEMASPDEITFLRGERLPDGINVRAGAILVRNFTDDLDICQIKVSNPDYGFAKLLELFYVRPFKPHGISGMAYISPSSEIGKDVSIHAFSFISDGVKIKDKTVIFPHVFVGENTTIGEDCVIYPGVIIREGVSIGNRVIIHSGTVIGSDGFGYVFHEGMHQKIPQVGGVIIEDDVEIGANVTVDRATLGNTIIGKGTKIDNLVQIAHNVTIGPMSIIVAQVGIAGSSRIGSGVILAGQVGVKDHVNIDDGVVVGAKSGIMEDLKRGTYFGIPALNHREWFKLFALYKRLPELFQRIKEIERRMDELNKREGG